jgi:tRNA(Ile)-lysidine synthase
MKLEIATLDHGLRAGSDAEGRAVEKLSAELGLSWHTRALSLAAGPGVEARARRARYQALEEIRRAQGLDWIATAHTASDQAETVLMRLARGSALSGAAGILERRGRVIRPLLRCTRAQTQAYVQAQGLQPATDPMNADPQFLRARIRGEVIPALERAVGGTVARPFADFARFAAEDDQLLSRLALSALERLEVSPGALDAVGLRALERPLRRRVLAALLAQGGIPVRAERIEAADEAVGRGLRASLSRSVRLDATGGLVRIARPPVSVRMEPVQLGETWRDAPATGLSLLAQPEATAEGELHAGAPPGAEPPFHVRFRAAGDRVPWQDRSRKLQDVLVDLRFPAELRAVLPVITSGDGKVAWVPGVWSSTAKGRWHLAARFLPPGQAPQWLVRYRLQG